MADAYFLPQSDPCYSTLEAYKVYVREHLQAFAEAFHYQQYGGEIEQWRQCCPIMSEQVERTRPRQPDPEPLRTFTLPAHLFNPQSACAEHLYFRGATVAQPLGKAWFEEEQAKQHERWESTFSRLKEDLHTCCVQNFNSCVGGSGRRLPAADTLEGCVQKFSPEHQPKVAVPGAPAAARTAVAEGQSLEQQYLSCRKERNESQGQAEQAKKEQLALQERVRQGEAFSKDLAACQATAAGLKTEIAGLRPLLQQVGPRPGAAALAAFPEGADSIELGLLAAGALGAGFFLGRSGGRRRWAKLVAGSAGALVALLVFLGIIALMPDVHWPELLLALTAAVLLMSLATLRRFARRLRGRDGGAPPESAAAEAGIDLDEAEKALAERWKEGG